jgi:hypothetical protein
MRELRALQATVRADKLRAGAPKPEPMWASREAMYDDILAERMPTLWAKLTAEQARRGAEDQAAAPASPASPKHPSRAKL